MKFKAGDLVTPIEDSGKWLKKGDVHRVERAYNYDGDNYVQLRVDNDDKSWFEWRFELAQNNMHIIDGKE